MNRDSGGTQAKEHLCFSRDVAMSGAKITLLVLFINWEGGPAVRRIQMLQLPLFRRHTGLVCDFEPTRKGLQPLLAEDFIISSYSFRGCYKPLVHCECVEGLVVRMKVVRGFRALGELTPVQQTLLDRLSICKHILQSACPFFFPAVAPILWNVPLKEVWKSPSRSVLWRDCEAVFMRPSLICYD